MRGPERIVRRMPEPFSRRPSWPWMLLAVLLVKAAWLAVDAQPRFFMGDSGSYLHAAVQESILTDRSWLYPMIVHLLSVRTGSLWPLILAQTLAGVAVAMLVYAGLRRLGGVSPKLAAAPVLLLAIEPTQLYYERAVMAEAFGGLAFAGFLAALSIYVVRPRAWWLPLAAALGVLAIALRLNLLPVVLVLSAAAPWIRQVPAWLARRAAPPSLPPVALLLHALLALVATQALHAGYKRLSGELMKHHEPAYTAQSGAMRAALVAPLIRQRHFDGMGCAPDLLAQVRVPLHDHTAREVHLWTDGGLIATARRLCPDGETALRKASIKAFRDDPLGLATLAAQTFAGYYDEDRLRHRLLDDAGIREPEPRMREVLAERFGHVLRDGDWRRGAVARWFLFAAPWLTVLLPALPFLAVAAVWRRRRDTQVAAVAFVAVAAFGLFAGHVLFSAIVSLRYLHVFVPVAALLAGWLLPRRDATIAAHRPS